VQRLESFEPIPGLRQTALIAVPERSTYAASLVSGFKFGDVAPQTLQVRADLGGGRFASAARCGDEIQ